MSFGSGRHLLYIGFMEFKGTDILSAKQFNRGDIEFVLKTAQKFEKFALKEKRSDILAGKVLGSLFYEPSTRTRFSFETAMKRLGGDVVTAVGAEFSSISKGETLEDTGRVISSYADVIVMRHPHVGSTAQLADGATVPVLNAGDGTGEHPTQGFLDLFTIQKECGKIDGLTVAFVGDLKRYRAVHSLAEMLTHFNVSFVFVSPPEMKMDSAFIFKLKEKGIAFRETTRMEDALAVADVVYMTRIPKEYFSDPAEYEKFKGVYVLQRSMIENNKPNAVIMHPLPRIDEITRDVDTLPGAAYFRQTQNGVTVRMTLLSLVLGARI